MVQYNVCGKCPHCGSLNFLDTIAGEAYLLREPLLLSILHAVICHGCGVQFGTQTASQLVKIPEKTGGC